MDWSQLLYAILTNSAVINGVGGIMGVIAITIAGFVGKEYISEKHMRALHSAVKSAVVHALEGDSNLAFDELREFVVMYLRESVPNALKSKMPKLFKRIGLSDKVGAKVTNDVLDPILTALIERYRNETLAEKGKV